MSIDPTPPIDAIKNMRNELTKHLNVVTGKDNEKKELTKNWICIMLYTGPKNLADFIDHGCKVMVYGWEYDDFLNIIKEMENEKIIFSHPDGSYTIGLKGKYTVKKNSVVPLLKLMDNQEYLTTFLEKNRENCDHLFLEKLYKLYDEGKQEDEILNYGAKHYDRLAPLLNLVTAFLDKIQG